MLFTNPRCLLLTDSFPTELAICVDGNWRNDSALINCFPVWLSPCSNVFSRAKPSSLKMGNKVTIKWRQFQYFLPSNSITALNSISLNSFHMNFISRFTSIFPITFSWRVENENIKTLFIQNIFQKEKTSEKTFFPKWKLTHVVINQ